MPSSSTHRVSPLASARTTPSHSSNLRSPQAKSSRQQGVSRQRDLHLSALPRFHPAVYCAPGNSHASSTSSSGVDLAGSPFYGHDSPQPPPSPRTVNRQFSEAQAKLWQYTREAQGSAWGRAVSPHRHRRQPSSPGVPSPLAGRAAQRNSAASARYGSPDNPGLQPVGDSSPSVTPLALDVSNLDMEDEEGGGYLVAGAARSGALAELTSEERANLVDALIERETDGDRS